MIKEDLKETKKIIEGVIILQKKLQSVTSVNSEIEVCSDKLIIRVIPMLKGLWLPTEVKRQLTRRLYEILSIMPYEFKHIDKEKGSCIEITYEALKGKENG